MWRCSAKRTMASLPLPQARMRASSDSLTPSSFWVEEINFRRHEGTLKNGLATARFHKDMPTQYNSPRNLSFLRLTVAR